MSDCKFGDGGNDSSAETDFEFGASVFSDFSNGEMKCGL
jgi:hypothetical protein